VRGIVLSLILFSIDFQNANGKGREKGEKRKGKATGASLGS